MSEGYEKLSAAIDRFQEAHLWLHMMEEHYHSADMFRWYLNVFLKALYEVPIHTSNGLQNEPGFPKWFRERRETLGEDPLIAALSKTRDKIVHHKMLIPKSRATVGVTEGRGIKLGMGFPINPLADSDRGMEIYLLTAKERGDFLGILIPDEDSVPCVEREWRLDGFDEEVVDLCARAWLRVGEAVAEAIARFGDNVPPQTLSCRRGHQAVRYKTYDRDKLTKWLEEMPERE